jgi:hypothetical protein
VLLELGYHIIQYHFLLVFFQQREYFLCFQYYRKGCGKMNVDISMVDWGKIFAADFLVITGLLITNPNNHIIAWLVTLFFAVLGVTIDWYNKKNQS